MNVVTVVPRKHRGKRHARRHAIRSRTLCGRPINLKTWSDIDDVTVAPDCGGCQDVIDRFHGVWDDGYFDSAYGGDA